MTENYTQNQYADLDKVAQKLLLSFRIYEQEFDRQTKEKAGYINRLAGWMYTKPILLKTTPGSGKSTQAVDFVNRLADAGKNAAYLTLSHDIALEMLQKNSGTTSGWKHWEGHGRKCAKAAKALRLQNMGYEVAPQCGCDWANQFNADSPAVMPVEYAMASDLDSINQTNPEYFDPIRKQINDFDIRIFDEIDLSRFIGKLDVNESDLERAVELHPVESIKVLSEHLLSWIRDPKNIRPVNELIAEEPALKSVLGDLAESQLKLPRKPWGDFADEPVNFPPYLVPIVLQEIKWARTGRLFNPRAQFIETHGKTQLAIRWRKQVPVNLPYLILDASADEKLLSRLFGDIKQDQIANWQTAIPDNVHISQLPDHRMSMGTLNLKPVDKGGQSRTSLKNKIESDLKKHPTSSSVGLVTYKTIKSEMSTFFEDLGFKNVRAAHYGNLRSLNDLEDCDVLVLVGCPTPPSNEIYIEAQAFFYDEKPISPTWGEHTVPWNLSNEKPFEIKMGGFGDERLNDYQVQKVEWELFQAVHRIRPIRVSEGKQKHILIYSNVPVPQTSVSSPLGRWKVAVDGIHLSLQSADQCTCMAVAKAGKWLDVKLNSQERWIRNNAKDLATFAGVTWTGKRFRI